MGMSDSDVEGADASTAEEEIFVDVRLEGALTGEDWDTKDR